MQQEGNIPLHTIVVVAKCPIPGKSKTRLMPKLGLEGSSKLAKAMLSDVLQTLSESAALEKVRKILFFAPANEEGLGIMRGLLKGLQLSEIPSPLSTTDEDNTTTNTTATENPTINGWILLPMIPADLAATNLGDILTDILKRTRALPLLDNNDNLKSQGKFVFLGMDSPELPMEEIVASLENDPNGAVLCPANDGGYGMLSVPPNAPTDRVFQGIRWSNLLTGLGQIKALTDANIPVRLGRMMNDIDEPEDVTALCQRLAATSKNATDEQNDVLLKSSRPSGEPVTGPCRHTRQVLQQLDLLSY